MVGERAKPWLPVKSRNGVLALTPCPGAQVVLSLVGSTSPEVGLSWMASTLVLLWPFPSSGFLTCGGQSVFGGRVDPLQASGAI